MDDKNKHLNDLLTSLSELKKIRKDLDNKSIKIKVLKWMWVKLKKSTYTYELTLSKNSSCLGNDFDFLYSIAREHLLKTNSLEEIS